MPYIVADRVRQQTGTSGTGPLTLSFTPAGFQSFASVCAVGDTVPYSLSNPGSTVWETGVATYTAADTLTRTTVLASSNGGALVDLPAGGTWEVILAPVAAAPVRITNTTNSTSSTTGALTVAGGVGVSGSLSVAGNLVASAVIRTTNAQAATNTTSGALRSAGGLGVVGNAYVGGTLGVTGPLWTGGSLGVGTISPAVSIDASSRTDGLGLPVGTTAQRPATRPVGTLRFNSEANAAEVWDGTAWRPVGSAATVSATAPTNPQPGDLWWDSTTGGLFIRYSDGTSTQWVSAAGGGGDFLPLVGGTLTGTLFAPEIISSGDVRATSFNGGQLGAFRNHLINADFHINQRGTGTTSTSGAYPADRWQTAFQGGTFSAQRVGVTAADAAAITGEDGTAAIVQLSVAGTANANDYALLLHRIEDVRRLAGRTVTLSFWARRTSGTGNLSAELLQLFGSGGSPSTPVDGIGGVQFNVTTSWQRFTRTISVPSAAGRTLGTNGDDNTALFIWASGSPNFNARNGSLPTQTATFQIMQPQLEVGPVASAFERRPRQVELALCQRFFQRHTGVICSGTANAAGNGIFTDFPIPVTMRTAPSVTLSNFSNVGAQNGTLNQSNATHIRFGVNPTVAGHVYSIFDADMSAELS